MLTRRHPSHPVALLASIVGLGALLTFINRDLPIVRNALLYAQIHHHLVEHGMRLWQVCGDPQLVFNKACGFPALAAPLIALFGMNVGLKWASCIGTALFVYACFVFFRRFNARFGLDEADLPLELLVCCLNPLVAYQSWSAYPDSLFYAGLIFSLVLLDRLVMDRDRSDLRLALGYLAVLLVSLIVKPGALVFFPLHAVYLWWYRGEVAHAFAERPRRIVLLAATFALALAFVGLATIGWNPLVNLQGNEGQYDGVVAYMRSVKQVAVFLALSFGVLLFLAPLIRVHAGDALWFVLIVIYAHIFMVYPGAPYNARYYVAILPLATMYVVRAFRELSWAALRRTALAMFLATNAIAVLAFNERTAFRGLTAYLPPSWFEEFTYTDCLRMGAHLTMQASLAAVNEQVPPGAKLYYVSAYYYGSGGEGVYQDAGLLRGNLEIQYAKDTSAVKEGAGDFYVFFSPPAPPHPRPRFEELTPRLFRANPGLLPKRSRKISSSEAADKAPGATMSQP